MVLGYCPGCFRHSVRIGSTAARYKTQVVAICVVFLDEKIAVGLGRAREVAAWQQTAASDFEEVIECGCMHAWPPCMRIACMCPSPMQCQSSGFGADATELLANHLATVILQAIACSDPPLIEAIEKGMRYLL